uniref:Peroxin/Ferlin domain-containing protein n=1 Tax=Gasterosteus aculeatus aculeatus TaxID=481459 RepID=A0AAQ4R217_GASAC
MPTRRTRAAGNQWESTEQRHFRCHVGEINYDVNIGGTQLRFRPLFSDCHLLTEQRGRSRRLTVDERKRQVPAMPVSLLWAVDVYGRVYSLSTAGQVWEQCRDAQMEFKRVTAAQRCCWGIACDNGVYLNVHASDLPVRCQEEAYENQRWNPVDGFSDRLLPSDRWQWSDVTGLQHQPLDGFRLPSVSWEWEGDWHADENLDGEPTEKGGWTYAIDFPATYTKDKKWNSCVRRKRWLRYRRYNVMDSWAKVPLPDPFSDISCGGWEISDEPRGRMSLWAVSLQGKVWFREGIDHHNPEGSSWEEMTLPGEVVQISCGPGDLVWAVLWEGQLIVREGVSRDCPKGTSWAVVDSPSPEVGATHVAVGINVVWALTKDNKVWFRRGVNSHNPCGSGWIGMVGEMLMINIGLNDQVFAVGREDRAVYFRQGVTSSELSGKTWRAVTVPRDGDRSHSKPSADAAPTDPPEARVPKVTSDSFISDLVSDREPATAPWGAAVPEEDLVLGEEEVRAPCAGAAISSSQSGGLGQWSNVDLEEAQGQRDQAGAPDQYGADQHPLWAWVSGGGCSVDSTCHVSRRRGLPHSGASLTCIPVLWTQSVWVKKGTMQWWRDWRPHKWTDVHFALEQFSGPEGDKDGILFIYYNFNEEKKVGFMSPLQGSSDVPVRLARCLYRMMEARLFNESPLLLFTFRLLLALLSDACCSSRGIQGPPSKQAVWSVTCKGDIFVSEPSPGLEAVPYPTPCDQMFWRQVGGHLRLVESNSVGVVWGIGYDHTAWVHTGGDGGGFSQGLASSTDNIYTQVDVKSVYIYENQRWNPVTGYTNRGLPTDRYMWSDASGLHECTKTNMKPPSAQWTWVSDWAIDYGVSGGTDRDGWQYAADFPASYHGYKTLKDFVRRRRWSRKSKLTTTGPWQEIPPISLIDVSLLPCAAPSGVDVVPLWAISNKGDVLCRLGVTALTPAGSSWLHVGTDQPFKSVSVGGASQVWAIAKDGSAFYRGSVSPQSPAGDCWYHIPSPARQKLKQVSVGRTSVFAVDENGNLWYRQGVTPSYPQGSSWEHISNNVRKVSAGPLDQVWIIADKVQGSLSLSCGTVCHRLGVQPVEPKGQSWDYGIGGGWDHITVRGNSTEPPRARLPSLTAPAPPAPPAARSAEVNGSAGEC